MVAFIGLFIATSSILLFAQTSRKSESRPAKPATTAPMVDQAQQFKVIAYYFHGRARCVTCKKIESLSHEVVASNFAEQLKNRKLEWQVVNAELPENRHFISDYQLISSSVVLVKYENGKQTGYKNLRDVWKLVNSEPAFRNYVKGEVQAALGRG